MPKESRKLGQDRPALPYSFQGVQASEIPKSKLDVSLDSILEEQEKNSAAVNPICGSNVSSEFQDIPVDLIDPSPFQPRLDISDDELQLLANSISVARRVNRPITLRKKENGRYEIIGGERRWRSVRLLGWETIVSRILDIDDAEAEVLALADNEGQEGLSDFERGLAYKKILERGEFNSIRHLANRIGVSHQSVIRCLNLTKLPQECLDFLTLHPRLLGNTLAAEYASAAESHPALVLEALVKIDQEGISQEQALRWIHHAIKQGDPFSAPPSPTVKPVRFSGGVEGALIVSKGGFRIKVPKGVDLDRLEKAIIQALEKAD